MEALTINDNEGLENMDRHLKKQTNLGMSAMEMILGEMPGE